MHQRRAMLTGLFFAILTACGPLEQGQTSFEGKGDGVFVRSIDCPSNKVCLVERRTGTYAYGAAPKCHTLPEGEPVVFKPERFYWEYKCMDVSGPNADPNHAVTRDALCIPPGNGTALREVRAEVSEGTLSYTCVYDTEAVADNEDKIKQLCGRGKEVYIDPDRDHGDGNRIRLREGHPVTFAPSGELWEVTCGGNAQAQRCWPIRDHNRGRPLKEVHAKLDRDWITFTCVFE